MFFDALEQRGVLDGAVVVVTSDHGEAFGAHGIVEHAKDVYEPLVSVPLIVRAPGQREGRVLEGRVPRGPRRARRSLPARRGLDAHAGSTKREAVPGSHPVLSELHFARPRDIVKYRALFQHERTALREGASGSSSGATAPSSTTSPRTLASSRTWPRSGRSRSAR